MKHQFDLTQRPCPLVIHSNIMDRIRWLEDQMIDACDRVHICKYWKIDVEFAIYTEDLSCEGTQE